MCPLGGAQDSGRMDETTAQVIGIVVTAAAGLAGVALGGLIAWRTQREQLRRDFLRRQLDEFYAPMLGMRALILVKSTTRVKVGEALNAAWFKLIEGRPPEQQIELEEKHVPGMEKVIEYDNQQFREQLLPMYRRMVEHFTQNMGLAEPETRRHYAVFVRFVEIWDRSEKGALPPEVIRELKHSEDECWPLYRNLAENVERLQKELKK